MGATCGRDAICGMFKNKFLVRIDLFIPNSYCEYIICSYIRNYQGKITIDKADKDRRLCIEIIGDHEKGDTIMRDIVFFIKSFNEGVERATGHKDIIEYTERYHEAAKKEEYCKDCK